MARSTNSTTRTATARNATSTRKAPAARAPVPTKDELRARVEKLERTNTTLRAKSREATRAAKTADARIAELEEEIARLEKRVSAQGGAAKRGAKRAGARRGKSPGREIDPGDAVPEGVAVQEPQPLDKEAETALENLEEHLGGE